MADPLHVLIIEDSLDDAELVVLALQQSGFAPVWQRVETAEAMRAALASQAWDVVLADYALPQFSGPAALQVLHESGLDLPFIMVSGTIGEERAAEMMRAGAHDVVLKGHLTLLPPAIERELREAQVRQERRHAQQELVIVNRGLRLLSAINQTLLRTSKEDELLQSVCRIAVESGGYSLAWVGYAEQDETHTVRPEAHAGINGDYLAMLHVTWDDSERGRGPTGTAIRTGQPVFVCDISTASEFTLWRDEALKRGFHSAIALPLTVNETTIGAFSLYTDVADTFTTEEVNLLTEMANDLAYGILALRTREELRDREAQYRTIVETAQEGIWVIDRNFRTTYVNQRMAEMLGYRVEEMLGKSIFDFIDRAMRAEIEEHLDAHRRGIKDVYEFCFRTKDSAARWVITSTAPILDTQGNFTGAFAMITDITERHQFEEYQREFSRRTIEAATDGKLLIREQDEIMQLAGPSLMSWTITRAEDLEEVRHAVAEAARTAGMDEERIFDFILCISEATTNAVKHAGSGTLSLHKTDDTLLAVVVDHGPGIQAINLPEVALKRSYSTAVSLGMGYKAMISLADIVYLATGPAGTTVAIAMSLHKPEQPPLSLAALPDVWEGEG